MPTFIEKTEITPTYTPNNTPQEKNLNPNAFFLKLTYKKGSYRTMKSEQEMLDRIKSHSCRTLLLDTPRTIMWDTLLWHSCGILLWGTLVGHFDGTLLWDTLAWHSCSTLLWHTLVKHSLSLNTLEHSCKTLLLDTLTWHIWNTSPYYFVLQSIHTVPHSTTLYCKSCTE